ncbi:amphi-Trp domain-containing protein [Haloarcula onubensis]|uniref:Amphi-Trp domain-containing protein n=1 Tax=Haloarcula onubensis TaxID=2950539 RepID=A0ABU2FNJ0_9EURY|nr:amphi-Trp domain-containing protein [Halomicroarcula sp. S3CR25-11]MDS0282320.1 amphi-Trp domain-containing protein [Halomicroarcula sp. S3CR25-11]
MSEIEAEREMTRSEIATYLHEFADELDSDTADREPGSHRSEGSRDGRVTFMVGDDSATVNPPEQLSFEVEVGADDSFVGGNREQAVSFDLVWQTAESQEENGESEMEIK